ncbi:MAG: HAD-IA family hydrolase [Oscillospiraceae bacterium]|nr:HAD-IA family hydrolase [Oscillospiraceae bacterium]
MKYRVVIFDLDGTLLYTLDDLWHCVNHALAAYGLPERSRDEVRRFVGNGLRKLISRAVPDGTPDDVQEQVFAELKAYYDVHYRDYARLYEGIIPMLKELKEAGCMTAVASNKADRFTQKLCRDFFGELIDFSVGEHPGVDKKPAPDMVRLALERFGLAEKDALYVGDSEVDISTAENSGVDAIIVDWGFRDRSTLEEKGADVIISSPDELTKIVLEQ